MQSLIEDLSVLTTIPTINLNQLAKKSNFCICNCVAESKLQNESLTSIDIGIGELQIFVENDNIKYKFIPSKALEKGVKSTVLEGKNILTNELENALSSKIMNAHKDYF